MKIAFDKISNGFTQFCIDIDKITFNGTLKRKTQTLIECKGSIKGVIKHNCDRCGEDIDLLLDEEVNLILSDGIYNHNSETMIDLIEFWDKNIDLNEVLSSEIEAYKSDYFYCKNCQDLN